jgi:FRG domain
MTIKVIRPRSVDGLFRTIDSIALESGECVFRGHRVASWRLDSTLNRHSPVYMPDRGQSIDEMSVRFFTRLTKIGVPLPFDTRDRRACLEFCRHFGIPSPLIDFSRSPYVALFFALSGIRPHNAKKTDIAALLCLHVLQTACCWGKMNTQNHLGKIEDSLAFSNATNRFHFEVHDYFKQGYPYELKYIDYVASWNRRVQRQMGCLSMTCWIIGQ